MENKLDDGICETCGSCWPSAAAKNRHMKAHKKRNNTFETTIDYQEVDDEFAPNMDMLLDLPSTDEEPMPIIGNNMKEFITSPFEQIHDELSQ